MTREPSEDTYHGYRIGYSSYPTKRWRYFLPMQNVPPDVRRAMALNNKACWLLREWVLWLARYKGLKKDVDIARAARLTRSDWRFLKNLRVNRLTRPSRKNGPNKTGPRALSVYYVQSILPICKGDQKMMAKLRELVLELFFGSIEEYI